MSGTMQSLRHRIDSAGDLQGVVGAMKALAASSIGQYQKAVGALDDYYRTVELGLSACLRQTDPAIVATPKPRKGSQPVGAVVFGSDQGLVGRFNEVVVDLALKTLKALPGKTQRLWAVGERAHSLLTESGLAPVDLLTAPASVQAITSLVGNLLIDGESAREKGEVVDVYVFHNHPKSATLYEPVGKQLLPLDSAWQQKLIAVPWPSEAPPEIIGETTPTLESFIRGYLFVLLFQACAESLNSENASRLGAMQRAEKNIRNILQDLNEKFHRVRQASIDEELFDVVSGFEALSPNKK
jgi:F-type H+-transporting ATPase subunit gamma